jgi:hypothetical protein
MGAILNIFFSQTRATRRASLISRPELPRAFLTMESASELLR